MGRTIQALFRGAQKHYRHRRAGLFRRLMRPSPQDWILDLGGGYGDYFATVVPFRDRVYIADIDERILAKAREFGFRTLLIPTNGEIPAVDHAFDIVHCNSVIEHVPVECRTRLAQEIQRVGRSWFVQTPNRFFPIEPHTRLPLGQFMPRPLLRLWRRYMGKIWNYTDDLCWNLLSASQLQTLFPQGRLFRERCLGLTKALITAGGERLTPTGQTVLQPAAEPAVQDVPTGKILGVG